MDLIGLILVILGILGLVGIIAIGVTAAVVMLVIGGVLLFAGYGWGGGRRYRVWR